MVRRIFDYFQSQADLRIDLADLSKNVSVYFLTI